MNENEIWRDIEGYEGLYEVSNLGRVKSLKYGKEKIMKFAINRNGYLRLTLLKNNKKQNFSLHRLVASAFIPNPNNYPYVNHKDENKENNCVDNLEWCDAKYNANFGTAIERRIEKQKNGSCSKKVFQYNINGELIYTYPSTMEAERNGFDNASVSKCCRGELKSYKGFIWSYTELDKKQEN